MERQPHRTDHMHAILCKGSWRHPDDLQVELKMKDVGSRCEQFINKFLNRAVQTNVHLKIKKREELEVEKWQI